MPGSSWEVGTTPDWRSSWPLHVHMTPGPVGILVATMTPHRLQAMRYHCTYCLLASCATTKYMDDVTFPRPAARGAAWADPDDANLVVEVAAKARLRKLRAHDKQTAMDGGSGAWGTICRA